MTNRYLQGNYAPVTEEVTATELPVTGTLPADLDGRYLRNGPNPLPGTVDPASYHWFLGAGMVHGVRLRDGRAEWYRNRWVRSSAVAEELGEPVRPGPVHAGMDFAANTHVIGHAGRTFAIVEAGSRPYELTDELGTIGPCDFDGTLPGGFTAHPHLDPATGELHAVAYFWGWGDKVQYLVVGTDGRVRRTVDVEVPGSPMMHDFSLTERHVVLYDMPATFDIDKVAAGTLPYTWNPDHPTRVGVMARDGDGSDIRWFDVEPCYVYHPLNAYDHPAGDRIVLDVVRHPKTFATRHDGPDEGPTSLDRWTVDLGAGKVLEERISDRSQEFPRVDDRVVARPHRYGYTVGYDASDVAEPANVVIRHDLVAGTSDVRTFPDSDRPDELVFVPRSADAPEDDGILMGFVHSLPDDRTDLVLLDAPTLETIATIHIPTRIPHGFHGSWLPT